MIDIPKDVGAARANFSRLDHVNFPFSAGAEPVDQQQAQQAIETIARRVNELGLSEPVVAPYTEEDQILVQLPGVEDIEGAKRIIRATAQLRLTVVERGPFAGRDAALDDLFGRRDHDPALKAGIGPLLALGEIEPLRAWWMALILADTVGSICSAVAVAVAVKLRFGAGAAPWHRPLSSAAGRGRSASRPRPARCGERRRRCRSRRGASTR